MIDTSAFKKVYMPDVEHFAIKEVINNARHTLDEMVPAMNCLPEVERWGFLFQDRAHQRMGVSLYLVYKAHLNKDWRDDPENSPTEWRVAALVDRVSGIEDNYTVLTPDRVEELRSTGGGHD